MEPVLTIDLTSAKGVALVSQLEGGELRVLEKRVFERELFFRGDSIASEVAPSTDGSVALAVGEPQDSFASFIRSLTVEWTTAVLIVSPPDYLSLNVNLPFKDGRSIAKVLDLEVQDLVPFEISEFLLSHRPAPLKDHLYDIHVGLLPKAYVRDILLLCKAHDIEPIAITTPSSVLGALFTAPKVSLGENTAIIYSNGDTCSLIYSFGGEVRGERIIHTASYFESKNGHPYPPRLVSEVALSLSAAERKYEKTLTHVYFVGDAAESQHWKTLLPRPIESLSIEESLGVHGKSVGLAGLGALCIGTDTSRPPLLSNFRTREFSYNPRLKELLAAGRRVLPFVWLAVGGSLIALVILYLSREYYIDSMRSYLRGEIARTIPNSEVAPGKEIQRLGELNAELEKQLKDLGSPSVFSPLDALLELSKDFPPGREVSVTHVGIKGNKVEIEGTAPNYAAIERLERALNKNKNKKYANIKKDTSSGGLGSSNGGALPFSFEIWLRES